METIRKVNKIQVLSGRLIPSSRKGNWVFSVLALIGGVALVVSGVKVYDHFWGHPSTAQNLQLVDSNGNVQTVTPEGKVVAPTDNLGVNNVLLASASCPTTKVTTAQILVGNVDQTGSAEYLNSTTYYIPTINGAVSGNPTSQTIGNTSSLSAYPTAVSLTCDGKTSYVIKGVAVNESAFSFEDNIGMMSGPTFTHTEQAEKFGRISYKAKDILNDGWTYANAGTATNTYTAGPITFRGTANNFTAVSIATDGQLNYDFWMQTPAATQFGENELPLYIAVDADTTDYQQPTLRLDNTVLTDVKKNDGELNAVDLSMLSAYEYVYKVPDSMRFSNVPRILDFSVQAKSGVNPTTDIKIRPVAVTRWLSKDGVTVKQGVFKDDSSNSETASQLSQEVTLDLS